MSLVSSNVMSQIVMRCIMKDDSKPGSGSSRLEVWYPPRHSSVLAAPVWEECDKMLVIENAIRTSVKFNWSVTRIDNLLRVFLRRHTTCIFESRLALRCTPRRPPPPPPSSTWLCPVVLQRRRRRHALVSFVGPHPTDSIRRATFIGIFSLCIGLPHFRTASLRMRVRRHVTGDDPTTFDHLAGKKRTKNAVCNLFYNFPVLQLFKNTIRQHFLLSIYSLLVIHNILW